MSGEEAPEEKIMTINLKRIWEYSGRVRAPKAVRFVREQAARHLKTKPENVKIDEGLNRYIWSRGLKHPPRKVRVRAERTEEDLYVLKLAG
ncbi:50S ribosomal protein L31e [Candidatus Bathyarchaeota archaeon]|nr:50S ribosomal protein L31e [Candidatus Bathyarchaeota archaeon]